MIQCHEHPDKKAVAVCLGCNKPLCNDCRLVFEGKNVCMDCLNALNQMQKRPADKLISDMESEFSDFHHKLQEIIKEQKLDEEFNKFKNEANKSIDNLFVKFKDFKSKNNNSGYLICEKCRGFINFNKMSQLMILWSVSVVGNLNFLKKSLDIEPLFINFFLLMIFFQGIIVFECITTIVPVTEYIFLVHSEIVRSAAFITD